MQMPLGYASIPAPSLLEFHICRHFTKSLIWIEMQMPLGHILRINLQDLIGTSIIFAVLPKGIYCALKRKTNMKGLLNETLGIKNQNKESIVTST